MDVGKDKLLEMYRSMQRIRQFESKIRDLAMANEVPVVQPRRGAFPEILEKTGGGVLVEPDDLGSLADGILSLWQDRKLAAELGRRGAEGVREHYNVAKMAHRTLEVFNRLTVGVV